MDRATVPAIWATKENAIRLRCVAGSSGFLQTDVSLLGWNAAGTRLRTLTETGPSAVWEGSVSAGDVSRLFELPASRRRVGFGAGPSRALIAFRDPSNVEWWDLDEGVRLGVLAADLIVESAAVSESLRLAVVSHQGRVSAFALPSGERLATVDGAVSAAASPDGSTFATLQPRDRDNRLRVWRADGSLLKEVLPRGAAAPIVTLEYALDGRSVVGGLRDGALVCWDVETGEARWRREVHRDAVVALRRSPDGGTFFSFGHEGWLCATSAGGVARWQEDVGRAAVRWGAELFRLVPSPSGAAVALARPERVARVFDASTGEERSRAAGHDGSVTCLAVSADGRLVASGGTDGAVRVHEATTGETAWTFEVDERAVTSVEFLPDRPVLRTGGRDGFVRWWSLTSGLELEAAVRRDDKLRTRVSLDGSRTLVRYFGGLEVWSDEASERLTCSMDLGGEACHAEGFADASRVVVCRGGRLHAYDAATGRSAGVVRYLRGSFVALQETYGGLVCVERDGDDVTVTEEWGGGRSTLLAGGARSVRHACVAADGRRVVVAGLAHVEAWSLATAPRRVGRVDVSVTGDPLTALALSRDGTTFAVGTGSGRVFAFALDASD